MTAANPARAKVNPAAVFRWLSVTAAVPVAGISVLRAMPAQLPVLAVQALSFTPWLAIPAAGAALMAFPARSRPLQAVALALAAIQVFWLFPPGVTRPLAGPGQPVAGLVAMSINAELGGADAGEIVRLVREYRVDLLTVQEHTRALEGRLAGEGLGSLLPNRVSHPADGAAGGAVYSSFRLKELGRVPGTPFSMPIVQLELGGSADGAGLTVVNVHTHAPVDDSVEQWRSDLSAVADAANLATPVLLAGDFNATYDHREFRSLLNGGTGGRKLVDVAAALGSRLVPTWPMRDYRLPGVALDHLVTSRDITGSGYSVRQVSGTDHAAVLATLEIQRP
ncbi:MAG TPA: endonuclease/exonuclease/phosphatase family protein [Arthrobacter sp.]|jgi:endonuclease/exonuclease/phosphatase family metal-dependent hydrolase